MNNTKRMVQLALMVSIALVLSIVESGIPIPVPVPGVKLGLANIITMVVIVFFGYRDALIVVTLRCILASMFYGGIIVFLFSIAGGILSTLVMGFAYNKMSKVFGLIGISVLGAVFHNLGQVSMASIVMKDKSVFTYLPALLVSGIIMGCCVGVCAGLLSQTFKKTGILS